MDSPNPPNSIFLFCTHDSSTIQESYEDTYNQISTIQVQFQHVSGAYGANPHMKRARIYKFPRPPRIGEKQGVKNVRAAGGRHPPIYVPAAENTFRKRPSDLK